VISAKLDGKQTKKTEQSEKSSVSKRHMFLALLLITFPCINQAIARRPKSEAAKRTTSRSKAPNHPEAGESRDSRKEQKASFETVITSVNIKINKAFTCLVQKKKAAKSQTTEQNFKMISRRSLPSLSAVYY
jgi:hypothetical protein